MSKTATKSRTAQNANVPVDRFIITVAPLPAEIGKLIKRLEEGAQSVTMQVGLKTVADHGDFSASLKLSQLIESTPGQEWTFTGKYGNVAITGTLSANHNHVTGEATPRTTSRFHIPVSTYIDVVGPGFSELQLLHRQIGGTKAPELHLTARTAASTQKFKVTVKLTRLIEHTDGRWLFKGTYGNANVEGSLSLRYDATGNFWTV